MQVDTPSTVRFRLCLDIRPAVYAVLFVNVQEGQKAQEDLKVGGLCCHKCPTLCCVLRCHRSPRVWLLCVRRMLSSGIAQAATNLWKRHTLALLGVIMVAHIACFAVIVTQIEARHANAVSVNTIALSMAYASQSLLRLNFMVREKE